MGLHQDRRRVAPSHVRPGTSSTAASSCAVVGEPPDDALVRQPCAVVGRLRRQLAPRGGPQERVAADRAVRQPLDESGGRHGPVDRRAGVRHPALPGPRPARTTSTTLVHTRRRRTGAVHDGQDLVRQVVLDRSIGRLQWRADRSLVVGQGHGGVTDTARPARRVVRDRGHGRRGRRQRSPAGARPAISPSSITRSASLTRTSSPAARNRCTSRAGSAWQSRTSRSGPPAWSSTISSSDPSCARRRRSGTRRAPRSTVRGRAGPRRARRGRGSGPGRAQARPAPVGAAARPPPAGLGAGAATPGRAPRRLARGSARPRPGRRGRTGGPRGDAQGLPGAGRRGHDGEHPVGAGVEELVQTLRAAASRRDDGDADAGARPRDRARERSDAQGSWTDPRSAVGVSDDHRQATTREGEVSSPHPASHPG